MYVAVSDGGDLAFNAFRNPPAAGGEKEKALTKNAGVSRGGAPAFRRVSGGGAGDVVVVRVQ